MHRCIYLPSSALPGSDGVLWALELEELNLQGPSYLTYDEALILKALRGLAHLPGEFGLSNQNELLSYARLAWRPRLTAN